MPAFQIPHILTSLTCVVYISPYHKGDFLFSATNVVNFLEMGILLVCFFRGKGYKGSMLTIFDFRIIREIRR